MIQKAMTNYEEYHHFPKGSTTPYDIEQSSAGVKAWASLP